MTGAERDDETTAVWRALGRAAAEGRPVALATIVSTRGSTPRKAGARMLVDPAGELTGTVGGGCGEGEVIRAARQALTDGLPRRVRVDLTEDLLSLDPAVCGGVADVLVEPVLPPGRATSGLTAPPAAPADPPGDAAPSAPGRHDRGSGSRAGGVPLVRIHYRRPPEREDVFEQWLVHDVAGVKVTLAEDLGLDDPVRVDGQVVLERGSDVVWFTFPGAWHDIGRFHTADGVFRGWYANVLTPPVLEPHHVWRTTDLFLDVWLPAGGGEPVVLDRDELEEAVGAGGVDEPTAERAEREAETILRRWREGAWPPEVTELWTLERARRRKREGREERG